MKFTPNLLDDVRSRISITSVVGRKVQWDRRKSNPGKGDMWACCPFHNEKSPSFHVEERKGRYHCFGCKVSGDVFTFLVEKEGLSFPEAVEQLANEAGIKIAQQSAAEIEREKQRHTLYEVMDLASKFYQDQLRVPHGKLALNYLVGRGVNEDSLSEFEIGYAPNSKSALRDFLLKNGVNDEDMNSAGLVLAGEEFEFPIDRFRDRVMFPIHDAKGRTIAFGGRALSADAKAKYLNSPETPLFSKGQIVFNFHRARSPAFQESKITVVEGYLDVIMLFQNGFQNTVAPLGTAVTEEQLSMLWKVVPEVTLCFDGDNAGYGAASRTFDRALPFFDGTHTIRISFLTNGYDPADLMQSGKLQEFKRVLTDAISAMNYFWKRNTEGTSISTPEQKALLETRMQDQIKCIRDPSVQKHYWAQTRIQLADLFFRFDRTVLRRPDTRLTTFPILSDSVAENQRQIELTLLGFVVHFAGIFAASNQFFDIQLLHPKHSEFKSELIRILVREGHSSIAAIYKNIHPVFIDVLEEAHGSVVLDTSDPRRTRYVKAEGHNLFKRCPIARHPLPEPFAFSVFETLKLLHLRTVLKDDLRFAEQDLATDLSEKNLAKVDGILSEIDFVSSQIVNLERQLLEEGAEITARGREKSELEAA